jgi:hypothetical protein
MARFSEQNIACSQYALSKLNVDRSHCFLKIEEYVILCVPFQLGFRRSILLASLSQQELTFFQRYVKGMVGLSMALNPDSRPEPVKFFIHCNLSTISQMKGRENVGLFVVEYKTSPNELVKMLGAYLENQERLKTQYEDYGKSFIKITPETARAMGYNMYATIMEPGKEARRVQIFNLSSKMVEHMEAAGGPVRAAGAVAAYQFYFKKYRVSAAGKVVNAEVLPQGIVHTTANLALSPELVEIIDDYWYSSRLNPALSAHQR